MPRLAGIDIPERKKIYYALQYIHGIGAKVAKDILAQVGVDGDRRANTLDDKELASIAQAIDAGIVVEGALRRQMQQDIQRLKDIKSYRGERHRKGLPCRGQRTRTNARTRKGKKRTVAGKKGVKG
ncbi:MAG: 30S ribosomal protein S13 [Planctomycetes bacterium]|jgi:small subunit ribosomal protein S13|nr:30S ribosomal protein S13 [Planctomycetota bacterium]NBX33683.1 30S ribosomal protein S13 [Planctomycetota bacterium]